MEWQEESKDEKNGRNNVSRNTFAHDNGAYCWV